MSALAELLRPYNRSELARQLGTGRARVAKWARGTGKPEASELPRLAALLRMDLGELTTIVADDSRSAPAGVIQEAVA